MPARLPSQSTTSSDATMSTPQQPSASFLDANEETSNISPSSPNHRGGNLSDNPRLRGMRAEAKQQASIEYQVEQAQKEANRVAPKKAISKRKRSNIKSALICRSAGNIYIKQMEQAILDEEQQQLQITQQLFHLTEQNCILQERIRQLESRMANRNSWLQNNVEQKGFFLDDHSFRIQDLDTSMDFESAMQTLPPLPEDLEFSTCVARCMDVGQTTSDEEEYSTDAGEDSEKEFYSPVIASNDSSAYDAQLDFAALELCEAIRAV